jgi:hypothetical protein
VANIRCLRKSFLSAYVASDRSENSVIQSLSFVQDVCGIMIDLMMQTGADAVPQIHKIRLAGHITGTPTILLQSHNCSQRY